MTLACCARPWAALAPFLLGALALDVAQRFGRKIDREDIHFAPCDF